MAPFAVIGVGILRPSVSYTSPLAGKRRERYKGRFVLTLEQAEAAFATAGAGVVEIIMDGAVACRSEFANRWAR